MGSRVGGQRFAGTGSVILAIKVFRERYFVHELILMLLLLGMGLLNVIFGHTKSVFLQRLHSAA